MQGKETPEIEIIRLLRAGVTDYVSGQSLSAALGISRTAVWKHIKSLRRAGFPIEAAPSKGYRLGEETKNLFNGIEVCCGLTTTVIGKKIFFYPELDSTNVRASELARDGEPEGTAVIADGQLKGKGRLGRRWESPSGVNLYTSIILRPPIAPQYAQNLTFLSAVAVADTVSAVCPKRASVKWPNDVLIEGRKVAGILMEMDSEADRVNFVIAGIGVNINMKSSMFPHDIRPVATSIMEMSGVIAGRAEFAQLLYSNYERWYKVYIKEGFAPVLDAWKGFFEYAGKPVRVKVFNRTAEGICMGVDNSGALLVRTPSGEVEKIISGDVTAAG